MAKEVRVPINFDLICRGKTELLGGVPAVCFYAPLTVPHSVRYFRGIDNELSFLFHYPYQIKGDEKIEIIKHQFFRLAIGKDSRLIYTVSCGVFSHANDIADELISVKLKKMQVRNLECISEIIRHHFFKTLLE